MIEREIITIITQYHPDVQAIYLFGSYGTEFELPDSDVDLALLLPHEVAKRLKSLALSECWSALQRLLGRTVDLINLRQVNTVFQNEILNTGRILSCFDKFATEEFEMLTLSLYQKLNEERHDILESFFRTKRAYDV